MLDKFKFDKLKIYLLQIILLIIPILALFESTIVSKKIVAIFLVVYACIMGIILKKRKVLSTYTKQVILLCIGLSIIYVILFYATGLYFGYYKAPVTFGWFGITKYIIPLSIIIITSEYVRYVLLSQKEKFNVVTTFIAMVLIDVIVYSQAYDLNSLDDFLTVFGFIVFSSISCNLLYNYISARFGYKPIIAYRLITCLYPYILPIIPNVYIFFRSIARMVYPYIIYLILDYTYSKNNQVQEYRDNKKEL